MRIIVTGVSSLSNMLTIPIFGTRIFARSEDVRMHELCVRLLGSIACGGGHQVFTVQDANGHHVRRVVDPDCTMDYHISPHQTILLVKLEVHHRDPLELSKRVVHLLQAKATLRSAIGLKFYTRTGHGDGMEDHLPLFVLCGRNGPTTPSTLTAYSILVPDRVT